MVRVCVKWGKERFEVDVNTEDSPLQLKSQLFSLTGVNPDRQKVLLKGKVLGDNSWDGFELKDGTLMMMIGSDSVVPPPPPATPIEKDSDDIKAETSNALELPTGLKNLGNTCYLNATLQCFKTIPVVSEALSKYVGSIHAPFSTGEDGAKVLTAAIRDLYKMMDSPKSKSYGSVMPLFVLQVLHNVFPQFAARDENGWLQQDANECWTEILRVLQTQLKVADGDDAASKDRAVSVISRYMEGTFRVEMKNLESDAEPVTVTKENFLQLSCFLSQEVRYMQLGIKNKMTEEVVKNSVVLGRDAKYEKRVFIDRLPAYLSIQMVRFFYKEKDKVNAKILKDVKFPHILDLYDMCTPELQQRLRPARDAFKKEEDRRVETSNTSEITRGTSDMLNSSEKETVSYSFCDDPGSNNSGFYELQAVITHKGRSSSSGHYVGWVRLKEKMWAMCNDDEVHPVNSEDILNLSGGGDWHCAYLLIYGPRILKR